jgi:hypothetical protein
MLSAPKRLGSIRVARVVFGLSPDRVFRRDAPQTYPETGASQCAFRK